jgi:ribosome-binding ATPase YchF (GTP1/OBG family)
VHIEEKCWKLHPELNLKNRKKDAKKNNILTMDLRNQVESSFDVDEKIVCTSMQKEVKLSSLHHQEEKEMTKLFHINIQVKKTKIDALFKYGSQDNLIAVDMVNKLGLEVHNHPIPYPLGWVNKVA